MKQPSTDFYIQKLEKWRKEAPREVRFWGLVTPPRKGEKVEAYAGAYEHCFVTECNGTQYGRSITEALFKLCKALSLLLLLAASGCSTDPQLEQCHRDFMELRKVQRQDMQALRECRQELRFSELEKQESAK